MLQVCGCFCLGFENSRINVLKALKEGENVEVFNDMVDEFRGIAARAAASVVLWLTDQLPKSYRLARRNGGIIIFS